MNVVVIDYLCYVCLVFFVKQKTAYEMRISDWSSDVCSSDLNDEYGVNEQRRDHAVTTQLEAAGISVRGYLDQLLFTPGSVQTQSGSYFKVFSQFRKACLTHLSVSLPACEPVPAAQAPLGITRDPIPTRSEERRVGKECVSTCRSRWSPSH